MSEHISRTANEHFTKLTRFRQAAYDLMERAGDALFELSDAVIELPSDRLIRLRSNLCLRRAPDGYKGRGAKRKHGAKIKFRDPQTWQNPDETFQMDSPGFGPVVVRIWRSVHFRQAAACPFILAQVERLRGPYTKRKPRLLWFGWVGHDPPRVDWWEYYTRRYPIEHWHRFVKGRLHWTMPRLSTPRQCQIWTDLMAFITWELWLARPIVCDRPLPWQKPQPQLAPGRVCQGMGAFLQ